MSVICQNFVQNAWKKDLCSNCFKSVGDHEMNESLTDDESLHSSQSDSLNVRYISHSANSFHSLGSTTPHTTWKSLISDKNSKNSQPFNLEKGFQGRLLTINKATHGPEKKNGNDSALTNGHIRKIQSTCSEVVTKISNGHSKSQNISGKVSPVENEILKGIQKQNGENGMDSESDTEVVKNGKFQGRGQKIETCKNPIGTSSSGMKIKSKMMKSKSEDTPSYTLHGILKKSISSPIDHSSSRRGSNVGFKDEEPLVIGYGGRDFSPEELEWDMNTSDCENEHSSESLDETEDDRVFSKMTKVNTEFNSDNFNLLKNQAGSETETEIARLTLTNKSNLKTESEMIPSQTKTIPIDSAKSDTKARNEKPVENLNNGYEKRHAAKNSVGDNGSSSSEYDSSSGPDLHNSLPNTQSLTTKDKNDSINFAIKGDKTSSVVTSGNVTVVGLKKNAQSSTQVKNRSGEASRVLSKHNSSHSGRMEKVESIPNEDSNTPLDENNEWQESDGMAGEILQAINTSLTNRHKMNNSCAEIDDATEVSLLKGQNNLTLNTTSEVKSNICNSEKAENDLNTDVHVNPEKENLQSVSNVEPRSSFLHGSTPSPKSNQPSAIYGPASDLFVSRSNSSSSSSSDEVSKNGMNHSVNVIVNGQSSNKQTLSVTIENKESKISNANTQLHSFSDTENNPRRLYKQKPKVPAKPLNKSSKCHLRKYDSKTKSLDTVYQLDDIKSSTPVENGYHYSVSNASTSDSEGSRSITLIDHYAESNIYQEVYDNCPKQDSPQTDKALPRESKLAALAIELEQVRHPNGNTKRQAPAPPKVPDPPTEDPPNCADRASPSSLDAPLGFSSFRGEAMQFSSSSSTTSTSSQDTEAGYASWTLQGDMEEQRRHSKSKSSFLQTQYSKCKMIAKEYAEDSARTRKKFSIKKLLKIRKDTETHTAFDPNCPNPKAWKYSDHFDRPRAKLEIIHPMDLENKSVMINPGFESLHSGSLSSFTAGSEDLSHRNSVSSDYGSFYSDTMSPNQDLKPDGNYDNIPSRLPASQEQEDEEERKTDPASNSPTPSRTSNVSQASTLTSGSSRNGGASPLRPPKPPPPPRAHSLLPANKALNVDGTYKFPVTKCNSVDSLNVSLMTTKPQAPKRQCKAAIQRLDYGIYGKCKDNTGPINIMLPSEESKDNHLKDIQVKNSEENHYGTILDDHINNLECHVEDTKETEFMLLNKKENTDNQVSILEVKSEAQSINVTVTTTVSEPIEKTQKNGISRNKHPPITKAPARPPPIYMKPQLNAVVKNANPWTTLEDSYLVLTACNRDLLMKLVNQSLRKRKQFLAEIRKMRFHWSEFEIDDAQPSAVFAFGEKIAYQATIPKHPESLITLVVTVQPSQSRMNENNDLKYPVFGQFVDFIPSELLDNSSDSELELIQATVLVLDQSTISTIECFAENLPNTLTEENEKELCFMILQLIHSLKSLQAQGIELMDSNFQNLILAKTKQDKYNTLVFLSDSVYEENDYMSDSSKISLCQYALLLLFQLLNIQSIEESSANKFSSKMAQKVFDAAISLLSEEKAVSLSQTKTLFECFFWESTKALEKLDESDDIDSILYRWLDVKRANYIKNIMGDESVRDINIQDEYYSQFLIRTSVRSMKEVISYL